MLKAIGNLFVSFFHTTNGLDKYKLSDSLFWPNLGLKNSSDKRVHLMKPKQNPAQDM